MRTEMADAAVSIEIGGFNLIPIANSDGHRIIHGYGKGATS